LQEQLEKRANFQRLVALLGADEHVTNEFEIILSARQPKSPQAPNMVLTDSSEDLSLSMSRDFMDTPVGSGDEFKKSKITVRSYEPKEPIENNLELPSIVHENESGADNSSEISVEHKSEEKPNQIQIDSINSNNETVSSPYLARVPMSDSATNSPIVTNNNSAPVNLINFDDYCSRDELKLIEEAILMLRQDTKINLVKVRKSLVKHTMRNEEFEKNLKELKKSLEEQRNNSSETASTLEKELNELWQSVDGHLKEFKSDLFAEASRQIEQKSFEHQHENDLKMSLINEELSTVKDQLNRYDLINIHRIANLCNFSGSVKKVKSLRCTFLYSLSNEISYLVSIWIKFGK
jgi:DNA-binding transcriptional MerR regulator